MAFHKIPSSPKSLGPYGFVYTGNRTHIGTEVMNLKHAAQANLGPEKPRSRRRSKTARSRPNPRRSRASRGRRR